MPLIKKCFCFNLRTVNRFIGGLGLVFYPFLPFVCKTSGTCLIMTGLLTMDLEYAVAIIIIMFLVNVSLICATFKAKKILILPWLFIVPSGTLVFIIYELFICIVFSSIPIILMGLVIAGVIVLAWFFVYSFFQQIKEEEEEGEVPSNVNQV
ncbi:uncharacterized protein LOC143914348 [Arctopsyche grandis]|uniref:uncharacterized protein LOC143914348 n=1 Tax=Arctopsyche grandis TaxID=121162 RepID=UPI00406D7FD1